jgi:predicted membrane-bound spermidine synthase
MLLGRSAYLFVFITGFLAIGYEIVWFRIVEVLVKASPYAFSTVLAVYLLGIALGSFGMDKYLRTQNSAGRKNLFFLLQFLIGFYVLAVITGYYYATQYTFLSTFTHVSFSQELHPPLTLLLHPALLWSAHSIKALLINLYNFLDVFFWPSVFVFVPTVFMGASFPLISSLALIHPDQEGRTTGTVYFFNIAGNVLGGILTGFFMLACAGTEITLLLYSLIGITFGLLITSVRRKPLGFAKRAGVVLGIFIAGTLLFPKSGKLYEVMHISPGKQFDVFLEEGVDSINVTYSHNQQVQTYINGLGHGGRPGYIFYDMAAEAVSFAPSAETALTIGYGTGSITETILKLPTIKQVTVVELSNTLLRNLKKLPLFNALLSDSRINVILDDGRRFLLNTPEKFDLILMATNRTTTAYSNNIYSLEFFKLIAEHLKDDGIFMVWYDEERVVPKTVASVFDNVRLYKTFCLASKIPMQQTPGIKQEIVNSFLPQDQQRRMAITNWLNDLHGHLGDQTYIKAIAGWYPVNRDWKPVSEYYLGLKVKEKFFLKNNPILTD